MIFSWPPQRNMGIYEKRPKYEWQKEFRVFHRVFKIIQENSSIVYLLPDTSDFKIITKEELKKKWKKASNKEYKQCIDNFSIIYQTPNETKN